MKESKKLGNHYVSIDGNVVVCIDSVGFDEDYILSREFDTENEAFEYYMAQTYSKKLLRYTYRNGDSFTVFIRDYKTGFKWIDYVGESEDWFETMDLAFENCKTFLFEECEELVIEDLR